MASLEKARITTINRAAMKETNLVCTKCKKTFPIRQVYPRCDICGEPLEVARISKGSINDGSIFNQTILERYADFLPFVKLDKELSLGEGFTPLVKSAKLASELSIRSIWFKNESQNPTWSFKDRGTAAGIQHAMSLGFRRIGTVSTGNMAVSVAAYGARAGLETFVLVSANIPTEKLNPIALHKPILTKVHCDYEELYFESLQIGKQNDIYFINSDVPFRVEGSKTIAFEICEQMDFEVPDYVVVPTSSGGNIRGILKGFEEFRACGLIRKVPRMVCAQASGCSPIHNAYINQQETMSRFENPHTVAHAIENPYPPSGNEVLRKLRGEGGIFVAVTDEEILHAQRRLAEEGIFAQPAAAVPLAAVEELGKKNTLSKNDTAVCIVTGGGLKNTAVLEGYGLKARDCKLEDLSEIVAKRRI
jgi:threonine synthase